MSKSKIEAKVKPKCCITQRAGVKFIAVVSSVSGALILIISTTLILLNPDSHAHAHLTESVIQSGLDPNAQGSDQRYAAHGHTPPNRAKFIFMEPQTIAIMQIFSSMVLFSSHKEFRKFSLTWIVFHFFGVVINIAYLWNLPAWVNADEPRPPRSTGSGQQEYSGNDNNSNGRDQYFSTLSRFLLNFIGVNVCTEIFSILVLIEFVRHPVLSIIRREFEEISEI